MPVILQETSLGSGFCLYPQCHLHNSSKSNKSSAAPNKLFGTLPWVPIASTKWSYLGILKET